MEGESKHDCYVARSRSSQSKDWQLGEGIIFAGQPGSQYCVGAEEIQKTKKVSLYSGKAEEGTIFLVCEKDHPVKVELKNSSGIVKTCPLSKSFP